MKQAGDQAGQVVQKPQTKGSWPCSICANKPFSSTDPSALGHTGELAEPFTACAFPSVKSIFGLEPHTFYELLRGMAPGPGAGTQTSSLFQNLGLCSLVIPSFTSHSQALP